MGKFEHLLSEKTAKMTDLTGKTLRKKGLPGLYAIGSKKAGILGIWSSTNVAVRVRKFQSDWKAGKKLGPLDKMGLRFSTDVVFQVLEECPEEIWRTRMKYWALEAKGKGYTIWNSWEETTGESRKGEPGLGLTGPQEKLSEIQVRFGIGEGEMITMLENLERGLEHNRGRG